MRYNSSLDPFMQIIISMGKGLFNLGKFEKLVVFGVTHSLDSLYISAFYTPKKMFNFIRFHLCILRKCQNPL